MAEKPILFSTEMVRAILDGRKTVTRRIIKPQPEARLCYAFAGSSGMPGTWGYPSRDAWERWGEEYKLPERIDNLDRRWTPPCKADDILWVRETWAKDVGRYMYKANYSDTEKFYMNGREIKMVWRPSIHMPREAARLFLRVTEVRCERLRDITIEGVRREGASVDRGFEDFRAIWDGTVKPADLPRFGWDANPWVWVISFEIQTGRFDS